ncbi:unnamed protein product, partial [Allacma fusca]
DVQFEAGVQNSDFVRKLYSVIKLDLFLPSLEFTRADTRRIFATKKGFWCLNECFKLREDLVSQMLKSKAFRKAYFDVFREYFYISADFQPVKDFFQWISMMITVFVDDIHLYQSFCNGGTETVFERKLIKVLMFNSQADIFDALKVDENMQLFKIADLEKLLKNFLPNTKWLNAILVLKRIQHKQTTRHFIDQLYDIWGLDLFTVSLNFNNDCEKQAWLRNTFQNYTDNLLRIWKAPENLEKFVKSRDFVLLLKKSVKFRLTNIIFYSERHIADFFRMSYVFICLICADKDIYEDLCGSLNQSFEDALKKLLKYGNREKKRLLESETESRLKDFEWKAISLEMKIRWMKEFLNAIKIKT